MSGQNFLHFLFVKCVCRGTRSASCTTCCLKAKIWTVSTSEGAHGSPKQASAYKFIYTGMYFLSGLSLKDKMAEQ